MTQFVLNIVRMECKLEDPGIREECWIQWDPTTLGCSVNDNRRQDIRYLKRKNNQLRRNGNETQQMGTPMVGC